MSNSNDHTCSETFHINMCSTYKLLQHSHYISSCHTSMNVETTQAFSDAADYLTDCQCVLAQMVPININGELQFQEHTRTWYNTAQSTQEQIVL